MIYKGKTVVLQYTEKCRPLSSESLERNLMYTSSKFKRSGWMLRYTDL